MKRTAAMLAAMILTVSWIFAANTESVGTNAESIGAEENPGGRNVFPPKAGIGYGEALQIASDFVADYFLSEDSAPTEDFAAVGRLAEYAPLVGGAVWEFGFYAPGEPVFMSHPAFIVVLSAADGWVCWVVERTGADSVSPGAIVCVCGYLDLSLTAALRNAAPDIDPAALILRLYGLPAAREE